MPSPSAVPRPSAVLGRRGEDLAAATYAARGYQLLARNWRAGRRGELDLVLQLGRQLVVCEVKTRSSHAFGAPVEAVDWRKQRRVRALAAEFIAVTGVRPASVRFDVAAVIHGQVELIEAAF